MCETTTTNSSSSGGKFVLYVFPALPIIHQETNIFFSSGSYTALQREIKIKRRGYLYNKQTTSRIGRRRRCTQCSEYEKQPKLAGVGCGSRILYTYYLIDRTNGHCIGTLLLDGIVCSLSLCPSRCRALPLEIKTKRM